MEHKFKMGDRVRVIGHRPSDAGNGCCWTCEMDVYAGKVGTVDAIYGNIRVRFPDRGFCYYKPTWLTLVEAAPDKPDPQFQPGDRVRVKPRERFDEYPKDNYGDPIVGDLTLLSPGMTLCCGKEFTVSKVDSQGHVCLTKTPFTFSSDMIEPVEVESCPTLSSPLKAIGMSTAELLSSMLAPLRPQTTSKLPLINTTKLLTHIKLD